MATKTLTIPELLALAKASAPGLRAAGVLELEGSGIRLILAPAEPQPDPAGFVRPEQKKGSKRKGEPAVDPSNALYDLDSYGLPPGSKLPGFDPPNHADEDEHGRD